MKDKIKLLLAVSFSSMLLFSCSENKNDVSDTESSETAETAAVTVYKATEDDIEKANENAKKVFDAAQSAADKFSTAGATIRADIITSGDVNGGDSEKINFCNIMLKDFENDGIWAFKMEKFKIVSAVYSPAENSGIIGRYPENFTGETGEITVKNISEYLEK